MMKKRSLEQYCHESINNKNTVKKSSRVFKDQQIYNDISFEQNDIEQSILNQIKNCIKCRLSPCYNFENQEFPLYCYEHKQEGMIKLSTKNQICRFEGCNITASFNFEDEKTALYCYEHKQEGMINLIDTKGNFDLNIENKNQSDFFSGEENEHDEIFSEDDNDNAINILFGQNKIDESITEQIRNCGSSYYSQEERVRNVNFKCDFEKCNSPAFYNFENEKIPSYCYNHKHEEMINVRNISEHSENTYSINHEKKALYYSKDKKNVSYKNLKCKFEGCNIIPSFNFQGEKTRAYCRKHKQEGMINIRTTKCKFKGCDIISSFNFEEEKTPLYCFLHKKEGMINIKNKKCKFEGCNTLASFNFEDEKRPSYCCEHKKEGMINIKNKKCKFEGCNITASFNFEGKKSTLYCFKHKQEGMINMTHIKARCRFEECNITA